MKKNIVECKSIPCRLEESFAREIDSIYSNHKIPYMRKAYTPEAIQFEPGERAEVSIISSATIDKDNEVVIPSGVDFSSYNRNPIVLWNHQTDIPSVARCAWIKAQKDTIRAKSVYPERQKESDKPWFIDEIWDCIKSGILRAKSLGFLPRKEKREPTPEELNLHPEWAGAAIWDDVIAVEYSVCNIGVNDKALIEAINTKSVSEEVLKGLGINIPIMQSDSPVKNCDAKVLHSMAKAQNSSECNAVAPSCTATATVSLEEALKYVKGLKKKSVRKKVNPDELLARALSEMKLDTEAIINLAIRQHRNRGKV